MDIPPYHTAHPGRAQALRHYPLRELRDTHVLSVSYVHAFWLWSPSTFAMLLSPPVADVSGPHSRYNGAWMTAIATLLSVV